MILSELLNVGQEFLFSFIFHRSLKLAHAQGTCICDHPGFQCDVTVSVEALEPEINIISSKGQWRVPIMGFSVLW